MPQTFQVLRCYKCMVFQVHQTKKSNKWECKLCGEKQSIKRHYGLGTAKECRIHVQKLNGIRGEIDELRNNNDPESDNSENENGIETIKHHQPIKNSKWSNYVEETETVEENINESMSLGDTEVVLEIPKKRKKLNHNSYKRMCKVSTIDCVNLEGDMVPKISSITRDIDYICKSKSPQLALQSEECTVENHPLKHNQNITNKFIPPVINKNSKWAQFAEDVEDSDQPDITSSPSIETYQNDLLFSLCDDSDLDNVLNF